VLVARSTIRDGIAVAAQASKRLGGPGLFTTMASDLARSKKPARKALSPDGVRSDAAPAGQIVWPLLREELAVSTRRRETARVRIRKVSRHDIVSVEEALRREDWTVERVAANLRIDVSPAPRWDGETLIVPVVAEVLVKELRLVEELRITRRRSVDRKTRRVSLGREEVVVERTDGPAR
jgi:stress response protein YsnF